MPPAFKDLRATHACARCRRQKLKCDSIRPCTLCSHAGASCEPQTADERSRLNRKRLSYSRNKHASQQPPSVAETLPGAELGGTLDTNALQPHEHDSPLSSTFSNTSMRQRLYSAVGSSMEFAKQVIDDDEEINFSVHDDPDNRPQLGSFELATMSPLPRQVIQAAIEAYFDRFHWFVMLLHEPLFVVQASSILCKAAWEEDDLCNVMLVMMVSILGLQCARNDTSWQGHQILRSHALSAGVVVQSLLKEVQRHLYDIMSASTIEMYQTIMLLEIYHVYFGSLRFARHMAGVPARIAHGLGLQRDQVRNIGDTAYQVGIRCWNHAVVGELFASMIYGQPSSLDPAFSRFRTLSELDEPPISPATLALPIVAASSRPISTLCFHVSKFQLYEMIQEILSQNGALHLQNAISIQDLRGFIQAVESAEAKLKLWRNNLPPVFDPAHWDAFEPWAALEVEDTHLAPEDASIRRKLALQGIILQVLHDSVIILAHRPLLQCRISMPSSDSSCTRLQHAPDSLRISAEAALRISRRSIYHFKHHLALSFVFLHLFTAGVILCVPPIHLPYSELASESKAGVLRIISVSRAMSSTNSIARHTDQVLTKLYSKTIQREMDGALRTPGEGALLTQGRVRLSSKTLAYADATSTTQTRMSAEIDAYAHSSQPIASFSDPSNGISTPLITNRSAETEPIALPELLTDDLNSTGYPGIPYLQFGATSQDESITSYLSEHLDETFGAFNQMYDLNYPGGSEVFGNESPSG